MQSNDKKIAIVTGGTSGIGLETVKELSAGGYSVLAVSRDPSKHANLHADVGNDVTFVAADVSTLEGVRKVLELAESRGRTIDVLVNAAGFVRATGIGTPLADLDAAWDAVVDANLKSAFLMSMAIAPLMSRPGGRIVNIGSVSVFTGGSKAGTMAYAAAKAGLHGLTSTLAKELGPDGITVNTIAPGFIENTGMTSSMDEERTRNLVSQTAMRRAGTVRDVAAAVSFLVSADSSFITGEILAINGGLHFRV